MSEEMDRELFKHYAAAARDTAFHAACPGEAALLARFPDDAGRATAIRDAFEAGWSAKETQHLSAVDEAVAKFPPSTFTIQITHGTAAGEAICTLRAPDGLLTGDSVQVQLPRFALQTENGEGLAVVEVA